MKHCQWCDKTFESLISYQIYCSLECRESATKEKIAAKMAFKATWMANVDKSDRGKKNLYYTAAESLNNLVSALKYITR